MRNVAKLLADGVWRFSYFGNRIPRVRMAMRDAHLLRIA
jgi:hypothetical protein